MEFELDTVCVSVQCSSKVKPIPREIMKKQKPILYVPHTIFETQTGGGGMIKTKQQKLKKLENRLKLFCYYLLIIIVMFSSRKIPPHLCVFYYVLYNLRSECGFLFCFCRAPLCPSRFFFFRFQVRSNKGLYYTIPFHSLNAFYDRGINSIIP